MQILRDIKQIDQKLTQISEAAAVSDAAVRKVFSEFSMDFAEVYRDLPHDPFSEEYFSYQMQMYSTIAGKNYGVENEVSFFDVASATTHPFPYTSKNTSTAGMHISALGFLISGIQLPTGSKVLEFGAGWGNTTLALALLGFEVTVVEIEERFCELIRERAKLHGVTVKVIQGDFFLCETMKEKFDAIVFYECFHHCADHMRLLRGLHNVIKRSGTLYLGAEPILPDFPVPWGIRLDGESLWAIRQNGWMELGYREDYFSEALARTGWSGSSVRSKDAGFANLWTLKPSMKSTFSIDTSDDEVRSCVAKQPDGSIAVESAQGYILWGMYAALDSGVWVGRVHLSTGKPRSGVVVIDACCDFGRHILAQDRIDLSTLETDEIYVYFTLSKPTSAVEIRLRGETPTTVSSRSIQLEIYPAGTGKRGMLSKFMSLIR